MIKFENFIVGNSTFSLMAAIIRNNKLSKIIIADRGLEIRNILT